MYRFSFEVNNLTSEPQRYTLNGIALTDQADLSQEEQGYTFMGRDLSGPGGQCDIYFSE